MVNAVILAAGQGTRLRPYTDQVPKCMVEVGGVPLIDRMFDRLAAIGIEHVVVVSGYLHDVLAHHLAHSDSPLARAADIVFNERYASWGNFYSLLVAEPKLADAGFIKLDGDVLFDGNVLPALMAADGSAVLAVDRSVALGAEQMKVRSDDGGRIVELNKRMAPSEAIGEFIGVERIGTELVGRLFAKLRELIARGETDEYYERAYELMMRDGDDFGCVDVSDFTWSEIDDADDLALAHRLVA